jgi:hypothetical protein
MQGGDLSRAVGIEGGMCGICKACRVIVSALVEGMGVCVAMVGGVLFIAVMVSRVPTCTEGTDWGSRVIISYMVVAKGLAPVVLVSAAGHKVFHYLLMFKKDNDFAFFQHVILSGGVEGNYNTQGGFAYLLVRVGQVPQELCQGDRVVVFDFMLELHHTLLCIWEVIYQVSWLGFPFLLMLLILLSSYPFSLLICVTVHLCAIISLRDFARICTAMLVRLFILIC